MIELNKEHHPVGTRLLLESQQVGFRSLPLREARIVEWSPAGFVQLQCTEIQDTWWRPEALSVAEILPEAKK